MTTHTLFIKQSLTQWKRGLIIVSLMIILSVPAAGFTLLHNYPDVIPQTVDAVRAVVGPRPVALIEQTVFAIQDRANMLIYQLTGNSSSGWRLTDQGANHLFALGMTGHSQNKGTNGYSGIALVKASGPAFSPPASLTPIITKWTLPGEGQWRPLDTAAQPANQPPILWRTVFRPDPARPFAHVALVAMDMSRSRLHIMIGTVEPKSRKPRLHPRPGMIPPEVQNSGALLAAWNGGFKAVHGHYGMMSGGVTWLPPKDGMATLAIEKDGRVLIGAWGGKVIPNPNMVAWRQNNPPLIENGIVNPDVNSIANNRKWGATITKRAYTWRSGLGLSKDNRWLIYVAGNSLSTASLTKMLQIAGAHNAMQTDINRPFDRFETYTAIPHKVKFRRQIITLPLTAQPLIDKMNGGSYQFLVPYKRDFFYLTTLAGGDNIKSHPSLVKLWDQANSERNQAVSLISSRQNLFSLKEIILNKFISKANGE